MARALNSRADLLLLDEPTNHLDLDAIVWLEDWLTAFPGTLLMISHDRDFLDAIIGRVLHIENRAIHAYSGNYSQFEEKRAEELSLQKTMLVRQQRQVAHITSSINRFRASATRARQAQSRIKMLELEEKLERLQAERAQIDVRLTEPGIYERARRGSAPVERAPRLPDPGNGNPRGAMAGGGLSAGRRRTVTTGTRCAGV